MGVEIKGLNAGPIQDFNLSINNGEIALIISDKSTDIASLKNEIMLNGDVNSFTYVIDGNRVNTNQIRLSDIAIVDKNHSFRIMTLLETIEFLATRNSKECILYHDGHFISETDLDMLVMIDGDIQALRKQNCKDEWCVNAIRIKEAYKDEYANKKVPLPYKDIQNFDAKLQSILKLEFFEYFDQILSRTGAQASSYQNLKADLLAGILAGKKLFIFDDSLNFHENARRGLMPDIIDLFKKLGLTGIYFSQILDDSAKVFDKIVIMKDNKIARVGKFK